MGISKPAQNQITALATVWLQEKKVVAIEPLRMYLLQHAGLMLRDTDIEECLLHLLRGQKGDTQGTALDQALLFSPGVLGHWTSGYDILVIQVRPSNRNKGYAFYGVFEGEAKLIGMAKDPHAIDDFLSQRGITIDRWFPRREFKRLLGFDADRERAWNLVLTLSHRLDATGTQCALD